MILVLLIIVSLIGISVYTLISYAFSKMNSEKFEFGEGNNNEDKMDKI